MSSGSPSRPISRLVRTATAACTLAVLVAGLALPLASVALAGAGPPSCCSGGRCCCAGGERAADGPCWRRGCDCGRTDPAVVAAPLQIEAVLPVVASPARGEAGWLSHAVSTEVPLTRADPPPAPPPKAPSPAQSA